MTTYQDKDDAIIGERIFAQARRVDRPKQLLQKEGEKRILLKSTVLRDSACCVIELPLKEVLNKK
jgi:hypothetical protein